MPNMFSPATAETARPGQFTLSQAFTAEQSRIGLYGILRNCLEASDKPLRYLFVCDRHEGVMLAQRSLAQLITPDKQITVVTCAVDESRAVGPFLMDYLTKANAHKFDAIFIDGACIKFESKEHLRGFIEPLRATINNLGMFGVLSIVSMEPRPEKLDS